MERIKLKNGLTKCVLKNGDIKYRNSKDKLHCDDGPAVITKARKKKSRRHHYGQSGLKKEWYQNGKRHREDGPAVEWAGGYKEWHQNGKKHREDAPAIEYVNGSKEWWVNNKRHREDGPALMTKNRIRGKKNSWIKEWHIDGKLHREDGPAVEDSNGYQAWYKEDELHREDGPAVEDNNGDYKEWYRNGKKHCEDGPALDDGGGYKEWYIDGELHREDGPAIEGAEDWGEEEDGSGYYLKGRQRTEQEFLEETGQIVHRPTHQKLLDSLSEEQQKWLESTLNPLPVKIDKAEKKLRDIV